MGLNKKELHSIIEELYIKKINKETIKQQGTIYIRTIHEKTTHGEARWKRIT